MSKAGRRTFDEAKAYQVFAADGAFDLLANWAADELTKDTNQ